MNHYIYNKEGVAAALGLSKSHQVNRYKDNAIKAGVQPSIITGGVELFDIDILTNPQKYIQANTKPFFQQQKKARVQLSLF
ncbi:hypothetical protein [Sulfurimonas sp.]|uniref:hypothetical protein n=1 Tax=Sulfurimonas sp. TaxID=2022749 RepID=UPI0025FAEEAE|nr:hypothetical protein [Sulfurimonas sp.]MBW6487513.1 hypothetical protein [Sulfurimonas sp.]